jgi:hypothetical protein
MKESRCKLFPETQNTRSESEHNVEIVAVRPSAYFSEITLRISNKFAIESER